DAVGALRDHAPVHPTDQTVDRVAQFRFGDRQLAVDAGERIAAVADAVRPWGEELAPAARAQLVGSVSVEHLDVADGVRPQSTPDLHDYGPLVAGHELVLLARRRHWNHALT